MPEEEQWGGVRMECRGMVTCGVCEKKYPAGKLKVVYTSFGLVAVEECCGNKYLEEMRKNPGLLLARLVGFFGLDLVNPKNKEGYLIFEKMKRIAGYE